MDFKNKLKTRLYFAISYIICGLTMILVFNLMDNGNEYLSFLGLALIVIGIVRVRNYFMITKTEETIKKQEIAETDERNVAIAHKARSVSFTIGVILLCIAIIVLQLMNLKMYLMPLSMTLCAILLIYWISYWIIWKRS